MSTTPKRQSYSKKPNPTPGIKLSSIAICCWCPKVGLTQAKELQDAQVLPAKKNWFYQTSRVVFAFVYPYTWTIALKCMIWSTKLVVGPQTSFQTSLGDLIIRKVMKSCALGVVVANKNSTTEWLTKLNLDKNRFVLKKKPRGGFPTIKLLAVQLVHRRKTNVAFNEHSVNTC